MPHEDISTWFILTLSAEQAVFDQDFEHLDALLHRRDEILGKWEKAGMKFSEAELTQASAAEERLEMALRRVQGSLGDELKKISQANRVAKVYKAA